MWCCRRRWRCRCRRTSSFEAGACLGIPAMTAYHAVAVAGAGKGRTVLVTGGAGGVGHYAIQFAKARGATVLTTVSSEAKAKLARAGRRRPRHRLQARERRRAGDGDSPARPASTPWSRWTSPPTPSSIPACCTRAATVVVYGTGSAEAPIPAQFLLVNAIAIQFVYVYELTAEERAAAIAAITRMLENKTLINNVALDAAARRHRRRARGGRTGQGDGQRRGDALAIESEQCMMPRGRIFMLRLLALARAALIDARSAHPTALAQNATFFTVTYVEVGPILAKVGAAALRDLSRRRRARTKATSISTCSRTSTAPINSSCSAPGPTRRPTRPTRRARTFKALNEKLQSMLVAPMDTRQHTALSGSAAVAPDKSAQGRHRRGHPRRRHPAAEGQRRRRAQAAGRGQPPAPRQPAVPRLAADRPPEPFHRGRGLDLARRLQRASDAQRNPRVPRQARADDGRALRRAAVQAAEIAPHTCRGADGTSRRHRGYLPDFQTRRREP